MNMIQVTTPEGKIVPIIMWGTETGEETLEIEVIYSDGSNHHEALVRSGEWIKLERIDQFVNVYVSTDGQSWTLLRQFNVPMLENAYMGVIASNAEIETDTSYTVANDNLFYLHTDHLNSVYAVSSNSSKNIVWKRNEFAVGASPFGLDELPGGNSLHRGLFEMPLRFPGQYFDAETGLHYNYFRDYEPSTGRYIESDPIGLSGGLNTYTYVLNNPLSYIDPYGLEIFLQTHPVSAGQNHSKLTMIPNYQAAYINDPRFDHVLPDGRRYATLGAGPEGFLAEALVSNRNRERDLQMKHNNYSTSIYGSMCPSDDYEKEMIDRAFMLDSKFPDNLDYDFFPNGYMDGYNSNSYISGLTQAMGVPMAQPPSTPGFQKPVPLSAFK
jgi:RHS repeat-associated protein